MSNTLPSIEVGTKVLVRVGSDTYEGKIVHRSASGHELMISYNGPEAEKFTRRDGGMYRLAGSKSGISVREWIEGETRAKLDECF